MTTFNDSHLASMLAEQLRELHGNLCCRLSNASGYEAKELIEAQARLIDLWRWAGGLDEPDDDTPDAGDMDELLSDILSALRWASEASEFQPEGAAYIGWVTICQPIVELLEELLEDSCVCEECRDALAALDEEPQYEEPQ